MTHKPRRDETSAAAATAAKKIPAWGLLEMYCISWINHTLPTLQFLIDRSIGQLEMVTDVWGIGTGLIIFNNN